MTEFKIYYGTVVDNDDSSETGGKLGRVQVRLLPEMKDIKESMLPWLRPWLMGGMTEDTFSGNIPEVGSKIWCIFTDKCFHEGYYFCGAFIDGFCDYAGVESDLSGMSDAPDTTYPNLKFVRYEDGTIEFHNSDTGDHGVYHSTGSYFIINEDGEIYIYSGSKAIKLYNDSGYIECKTNGQIDLNGNFTVDA
jgi:hypothetical protein